MSGLREALRDYLELRRSLGYKLEDARLQLPRFIDFLDTRGASHITTALAMEWARRLGGVRGFARYRHASDPLTEIPPLGLLPHRSTRARPHLYSDEEVQRLLAAALKLPTNWHRTPLYPWKYHCLIGLLSTTGMRMSEALDLQVPDVDLDQALLTIRSAKLGKSRCIPLHPSTRDAAGGLPAPAHRVLRRRSLCLRLRFQSRQPAGSGGPAPHFLRTVPQRRPACDRREPGPSAA